MRIAIIRLSSLGDIITTLVFLDFIKSIRRSLHITWIVDSKFAGIVFNSPLVDEVCAIPLRSSKKNKSLLIDIYKSLNALQKFDIGMDFQGLLKSAIIGKLLKTNVFVGYSYDSSREGISSFLYTKKAYIPYHKHILERNFCIIKTAFNLDSSFNLSLLESRTNVIKPSTVALENIGNFTHINVLFVIETSQLEKQYPIESFYSIATMLKNAGVKKIYLIWNENKEQIEQLSKMDCVFHLLPHLDFDYLKALFLNIDLVIGGDTGITHLAWAMGVKSITLYGNTPINRVSLRGDNHISLCSKEHDTTIKGDFSINDINPLDVSKAAIKLLDL